MIDQPPEALVRGCNDPVAIGVLSDWIEEQYGIALDLDRSGWGDYTSEFYNYPYLLGNDYEHFNGDGWGDGHLCYYGNNEGNGGFGNIDVSYEHYDGNGYGNGFCHNYGSNKNGFGIGY